MNTELSRAEELDYHMLEGLFFNRVMETPEYIIAFNTKTADHYSNVCGRIRCTSGNASETLKDINARFSKLDRNPVISISPFTRPERLSELLESDGFEMQYKDVWMFYHGKGVRQALDASVSIKTVDDQKSLDVFIDTFNRSYSGTDPDEPYGEAPAEWGETFYTGFGLERPGRHVRFYILYFDKSPASVLLTSSMEGYGGIYGVGTVPEMRGKGLGTSLTLYGVHKLLDHGAKHVFLQTEKDTYNEKLYKKMGFKTEWESQSWLKL